MKAQLAVEHEAEFMLGEIVIMTKLKTLEKILFIKRARFKNRRAR